MIKEQPSQEENRRRAGVLIRLESAVRELRAPRGRCEAELE
jgi:hypothetical protein